MLLSVLAMAAASVDRFLKEVRRRKKNEKLADDEGHPRIT